MQKGLENYFQLVKRLDELCASAEAQLREHLSCREGCSECCKQITLFPVETCAIRTAIEGLPSEQARKIREHVAAHAEGEICPLLAEGSCLIYASRPVICRTHGLPILFTDAAGERRVDYCPRNLQDCKSVPGSAIIDLDRLNALLVAVNAHFISSQHPGSDPAERVSMAAAVGFDRKNESILSEGDNDQNRTEEE